MPWERVLPPGRTASSLEQLHLAAVLLRFPVVADADQQEIAEAAGTAHAGKPASCIDSP